MKPPKISLFSFLMACAGLGLLSGCSDLQSSEKDKAVSVESAPVAVSEEVPEYWRGIAGELVKLEDGELVPASDALENKDVIAVYYSASWCGPCRQFTPYLSKFYDEASEKYPSFQLILMSGDRSAGAMEKYMEWGKMNFTAVEFEERNASGLEDYGPGWIPYLAVFDAEGKQILGKSPGGDFLYPQQTLQLLENWLKNS